MTTPTTDYDFMLEELPAPTPAPAEPVAAVIPAPEPTRPRPLGRQVPSDDCDVTIDGTVYHPHAGEWLRVVPIHRAGDSEVFFRINQLETVIKASKGDPDEMEKRAGALKAQVDALANFCKGRVQAWNWTDVLTGEPLPAPSVEAFKALTWDELWYIANTINGNNPAARKNG